MNAVDPSGLDVGNPNDRNGGLEPTNEGWSRILRMLYLRSGQWDWRVFDENNIWNPEEREVAKYLMETDQRLIDPVAKRNMLDTGDPDGTWEDSSGCVEFKTMRATSDSLQVMRRVEKSLGGSSKSAQADYIVVNATHSPKLTAEEAQLAADRIYGKNIWKGKLDMLRIYSQLYCCDMEWKFTADGLVRVR